MKSIKVISRKLRSRFDDKQTVTNPIVALQGLGNGVVNVPNQAGMVYIRVGNEQNYGTAFNNRTPHTDNLSVLVGYDPVTDPDRRLFQVLSISQTAYVDAGNQPIPFVGPHGHTHEWGGGDDTYIEWRRLMNLRVGRPSLYTVTVDPGTAIIAGAYQYIPSTIVDLTADHGALVGTQAQYFLIYLDNAGVIQHLGGAIKASIAALAISDIPLLPGNGNLALAAVRLHANAPNYIGDSPTDPDIWDLRYPQSSTWSVGNAWSLLGNSGTVAATNFMGTTDNVDIVFRRNSTEWMRIDTATAGTPRVRIGMTGNPAGLTTYSGLSLYGDNASNSELHIIATGNGIYPTLSSWRSKGSVAGGLTAVVTDDYLFSFSGKGHDGTAWSASQVAMRFLANGNWAVGDHPTRIAFYTTPAGSTTIDEHARLSRGDFRVLYNSTNYVAIQPASTCGILTWSPEISGTVIVRSATPNIVGGAFGATPGNARGQYSVDFQLHRNLATQVASGSSSGIMSGYNCTASGDYAFIGGGDTCVVSGSYSAAIGGNDNTVSGNWAVTLGGRNNTSQGNYSYTSGRRAKTGANDGVFLFSDSTDADFNGAAANEFAIRARGGFRHAYDDNNYWKASISSAGVCTFSTLPAGAGFVFTPSVTISTLTATGIVYAGTAGLLSSSTNATLDSSGNGVFAGILRTSNTTAATTLTDGALRTAGGLSVGANIVMSGFFRQITTNSYAGNSVFDCYNVSATGYGVYIQGGTTGKYSLSVNDYTGAARMVVTDGVVVGAPTGGDKGIGSINAVTVYKNGTALDFVFEPGYNMLSIDEMRQYYERNKCLPTLKTNDVHEEGSTNMGALTDRLWETVEVQARYIAELHQRLERLERL